MLYVGCSNSPGSYETSDPANTGGEAAPPSDDPASDEPAGTTVVCHLECSETEASGSGATEEEARADVSRHISRNCRPEDGQYFIF